jgi:hypothetical protein
MKQLLFMVGCGLLGLTVCDYTLPAAIAQCVQGDVALQYNISGSNQPTNRSNNVVMESQPGCYGNASVTRSVQGNIGGTQPLEQHREVRQVQQGNRAHPAGVSGSTVKVRSQVGIDVYNPADRFERP